MKRKESMVDMNVVIGGWTGAQEVCLQKAYIATKPTPHFWKEVAKLVPGKHAQECFDKVHSQYLTPPQPRPRARVKKSETLLLSPTQLLKPCKRSKRVRKSGVMRKNIQKLLQKNHRVSRDLFSVLEPTKNLPIDNNVAAICTPGSNCKYRGSAFGSPMVLKPIKNQALHDKYIARLKTREAKRKAEAARKKREVACVDKSDGVRAAKMALVSGARDAIKNFQQKQSIADCCFNELEVDDDGADDEDCDLKPFFLN